MHFIKCFVFKWGAREWGWEVGRHTGTKKKKTPKKLSGSKTVKINMNKTLYFFCSLRLYCHLAKGKIQEAPAGPE